MDFWNTELGKAIDKHPTAWVFGLNKAETVALVVGTYQVWTIVTGRKQVQLGELYARRETWDESESIKEQAALAFPVKV